MECRRPVDIWRTQASSCSDNVKIDRKFIPLHVEQDTDLCRLKRLPCRQDGPVLVSNLTDLEQRIDVVKLRIPEVELIPAHMPLAVSASGSTAAGNIMERQKIVNEYVDSPVPVCATTRMTSSLPTSTSREDVKPCLSGDRIKTTDDVECSIICQRCGRCRCDRCVGAEGSGRELPGVWCGPRCGYCTPSRIVDVVTCVCCVRAVVYHCSAEDDARKADSQDQDFDEDMDDCPCSCSGSPSSCRRRWACLAALGGLGCLPCLMLYWPLTALVAAVRSCFNAARHRRGCRCGGASSNEKSGRGRFLLPDTDTSSI